MQITWLTDDMPFPSTARALGEDSDAPGLLAAGGGLSPERLCEAYRHGIFPWYAPGQPVLWWSTSPRMVLPAAEFKLSRSLRKTLQRFAASPGCEIRFDHDFRAVIQACASTPRDGQPGTWIVPEMIDAYVRLHRLGVAHSVETWIDGHLAGGLYCLNLGRMVFGESMFAHRTDASKIALAALVAFCRAEQVRLIDCQQDTSHLASLGARPVPRAEFEAHLAATVAAPEPPRWAYDPQHWRLLGLAEPSASEPSLTTGLAAPASPAP
ncbi:MAG TPA: leucyl/phenylalanyl-tRNA--protein transferase [Ideonella sp.]|uniref:leucyl/phenylalanyl-tRNA--protein transferase n=1 Tax=Ideonella sp. TaxID=1929293 RepID=UPI002CD12E3A|nr:leucyl/phenylalanyl-tRNA--protein transferase [Ideonella sp.]HSI47542.1 leucyl/phenylalanyl-tRNA--protein transferase [Ideonella sp.]